MEISDLLVCPPEAFGDFSVTPDGQHNSDGPLVARHRFACRKCGGSIFKLEEVLSGEHGPAGVEATCSGCGEAGTVFHASRHGYDGRLGNLGFLQATTGRQLLCDDDGVPVREGQIACELSYSTQLEELASIAAEEGFPARDFFDGFAILTRSSAGEGWRYVWDYECA